ncbi:MAG: hypothetical protein PHE63_00330 [Eubacteriales bacterium]|nr:hypothetical protein [Eubacteriales bacterium]
MDNFKRLGTDAYIIYETLNILNLDGRAINLANWNKAFNLKNYKQLLFWLMFKGHLEYCPKNGWYKFHKAPYYPATNQYVLNCMIQGGVFNG